MRIIIAVKIVNVGRTNSKCCSPKDAVRVQLSLVPRPSSVREERGRVWNIIPRGSVPKAEIPRQVLIGHNTGVKPLYSNGRHYVPKHATCTARARTHSSKILRNLHSLYARETTKARLHVMITCAQHSFRTLLPGIMFQALLLSSRALEGLGTRLGSYRIQIRRAWEQGCRGFM